jgi:hypothetical protein
VSLACMCTDTHAPFPAPTPAGVSTHNIQLRMNTCEGMSSSSYQELNARINQEATSGPTCELGLQVCLPHCDRISHASVVGTQERSDGQKPLPQSSV